MMDSLVDKVTKDGNNSNNDAIQNLPSPTVSEGKEVPFTTYTTKLFQAEGALTSSTIHLDRSDASFPTR